MRLICEYNSFNDYLRKEIASKYKADKEFLSYFNKVDERLKELYPMFDLDLDVIIEHIYEQYNRKQEIDDCLNELYFGGLLFSFNMCFNGN